MASSLLLYRMDIRQQCQQVLSTLAEIAVSVLYRAWLLVCPLIA